MSNKNLTDKILYDFSTFGKSSFELANKTKEREGNIKNKSEILKEKSEIEVKDDEDQNYDFSILTKIDTKTNGPFNLDEWLIHINKYSQHFL